MKDYYSVSPAIDLADLISSNGKLGLPHHAANSAAAGGGVFKYGVDPSHNHPGDPAPQSWYRRLGKRVLDTTIVLLSLPVTAPVILLCALALWIESGLPFYTQKRLGAGGKVFSILKLRTMTRDADRVLEQYLDADPALRAEWDSTQKLKNDPRITRLGGFLRSTSLDELPQLWNVLTGDMSLVGPRPMMLDQLSMYGNPRSYFALRPGITGYWQISARNEKHFSYRNEVDAIYDNDLSVTRDISVLMKTFGVVLRRTGY